MGGGWGCADVRHLAAAAAGAWSPVTMRAIGDTSSILLFSGFVGVQGTVRTLVHA
jgi:hypothetical protein